MGATPDDLDRADGAERDASGALLRRPGALALVRSRALALVVALLMVAVLGVGWVADGLGAAPQTATQGKLTQRVGLTTVSLTFRPSPLRAGQAESPLLRVTDVSGKAVVGARAQCALSMPEMAMALPEVAATPTAQPGMYACPAQALSAGAWTLALTLVSPTGETDHANFQFVVA